MHVECNVTGSVTGTSLWGIIGSVVGVAAGVTVYRETVKPMYAVTLSIYYNMNATLKSKYSNALTEKALWIRMQASASVLYIGALYQRKQTPTHQKSHM